jgi:hypothetical protein
MSVMILTQIERMLMLILVMIAVMMIAVMMMIKMLMVMLWRHPHLLLQLTLGS